MISALPSQPRPDDQVAAGYITLTIGGNPTSIRVLRIRENRPWAAAFQAATDTAIARIGDVEQIADLFAQLAANEDLMIDLLAAYDVDGVLGGKEHIEQNALPRELVDALQQVVQAAFPFGADLMRYVPTIRAVLLQALMEKARSRSSTSGQPRSTGGRRRRSKPS